MWGIRLRTHGLTTVGVVTAGHPRHNSSNVGGVTAGQVGHNSSVDSVLMQNILKHRISVLYQCVSAVVTVIDRGRLHGLVDHYIEKFSNQTNLMDIHSPDGYYIVNIEINQLLFND